MQVPACLDMIFDGRSRHFHRILLVQRQIPRTSDMLHPLRPLWSPSSLQYRLLKCHLTRPPHSPSPSHLAVTPFRSPSLFPFLLLRSSEGGRPLSGHTNKNVWVAGTSRKSVSRVSPGLSCLRRPPLLCLPRRSHPVPIS